LAFSWDVVSRFAGTFDLALERRYEAHPQGLYDAILRGVPYDARNPARRKGVLSALLRRRPHAPRAPEAALASARA
jgi:hypothetical protein